MSMNERKPKLFFSIQINLVNSWDYIVFKAILSGKENSFLHSSACY